MSRSCSLCRGARETALLDLSAKEFQLLKYFIEHRGATVSLTVHGMGYKFAG